MMSALFTLTLPGRMQGRNKMWPCCRCDWQWGGVFFSWNEMQHRKWSEWLSIYTGSQAYYRDLTWPVGRHMYHLLKWTYWQSQSYYDLNRSRPSMSGCSSCFKWDVVHWSTSKQAHILQAHFIALSEMYLHCVLFQVPECRTQCLMHFVSSLMHFKGISAADFEWHSREEDCSRLPRFQLELDQQAASPEKLGTADIQPVAHRHGG